MIEKFRLNWRSNPQQQYDALKEMVMHLKNMLNVLTSVNNKLDALPVVVQLQQAQNTLLQDIKTIESAQSLLLQAIADNTACACNGISQVNDTVYSMHQDMNEKLDYIAELIEGIDPPVPVPVYVFNILTTSVEITQEIIEAGSFVLSGVSTKDGELFDQLTLVDEYDFIDSIEVISSTQIEFALVPGAEIPEGTLPIQVQQAESELIQQFNVYYEAPPVPVLNFVRLVDSTIIPLISSDEVSSLCTTGVSSSTVTVGTRTFTKYSAVEVCIVDGSLFVDNTVPGNFCREFSSLVSLTIPDTITAIGECFLLKCVSFDQPLTLPSGLSFIGSDFMGECSLFNSALTLPSGLESIGVYFMSGCTSYSLPLVLPSMLTFVGGGFMSKCDSFTGPLNIGFLPATVFDTAPIPNVFLYVASNTVLAYVQGVSVLGNNSNAFRTRFPNRDANPFRNLLPYGIVLTPNKFDFTSVGGFRTVKLTSTLPWYYARYWDDQGVAHEGVLPDWLQIDILNGPHGTFNLVFAVMENAGSTPRYASLDFTTDETSSGVVVEQTAGAIPLTVNVAGTFGTTGGSSQEYIVKINERVITQMDTTSTYQFNATDSGVSVSPAEFELIGTVLVNTTRKAATLDFDVSIHGYSVGGTQSSSTPGKGSGVMTNENFHLVTEDNGPLEVNFRVTGTISGSQITWVSCTLI
jgi:hypothetical protein